MVARRFVIHGDVQGVGFRYFTVRAAQERPVTGYVRNRPDGTVEVLAEGPEGEVEALLASVRRGPRGGRVDKVDVHVEQPSGRYREFGITW